MSKKIRNKLSILLIIILLSPIAITFSDSLFHHHDHFFCTAQKHEKHFHNYHHKCEISNFVLSSFFKDKQSSIFIKLVSFFDLIINYNSNYFIYSPKYSFLLRAPPVFYKNFNSASFQLMENYD